jgi:hypothetical protein
VRFGREGAGETTFCEAVVREREQAASGRTFRVTVGTPPEALKQGGGDPERDI